MAQRVTDRTQAAADTRSEGKARRQAAEASLVQAFQDAQARQLSAAHDAAAPLGRNQADMNDHGAVLRGAVEEVGAGKRDLHRKLYSAVDPHGTLALVATPLRQAARGVVEGVRADGSEMDAAEAGLFRRAQNLPEVASYRVIHALDRDVGAAMSKERRTAGETPVWARLVQLKGAVKSAIIHAVDNQVAHEARLEAAGQVDRADTIAGRLEALYDDRMAARGDAAASLGSTGTFDGEKAFSSAGNATRPARAGLQSRRQSDGPPRNPRVPEEAPLFDDTAVTQRPAAPNVPRPRDLIGFIRDRGGMQDPHGDLKSMGLDDVHGFIAKGNKGLSPDAMREAAAEAGYLGADTDHAVANTDVNDLLDAVGSTNPVHSVLDQDAAHAWNAYDAQRAEYDRVSGPASQSAAPPRAPASAYSQADAYPPGMAPGEQQAANDAALTPNLDKAAAERLKIANAAYADYARTHKNPIVGPGLKTTGYTGAYQRTNAAFIKAAIKAGPEGYENARAYLTAARNDPSAIGAMHEAALNPLRKMVTGNGTIPSVGLARWKENFGGALRALDEVSPGFSSRFDTAADATQALVDLGQQHRAALEQHQAQAALDAIQEKQDLVAGLKSANATDKATTAQALKERAAADRTAIAASKAVTSAGIARARGLLRDAKASPEGQFAKVAAGAVVPVEVENTVGGLLQTGTNGAARMRGLVSSVADNPDALAGLQRAGAGWMARTFKGADGNMAGGQFIKFLRNNRDVLTELYPAQTVNMMGAIARDAEVSANWRTETAVKGGSDSFKNVPAWMKGKEGEGAKHGSMLLVAGEAIHQGWEHGGLSGATMAGGGAALAYLANSLRSAGVNKVSDLYREALADPELARTLLARMPTSPDSGVLHTLARVLKRSLIVGPIVERGHVPQPMVPKPVAASVSRPAPPKAGGAPSTLGYVPDPRMQGRFMRVGP